ncbi:peptidoglycan-binding protein [Ideonella sp. DXS29W]|uniref:Peptidoglycan-binding protein n=1 Tax=Ideonella lacteola TaxID=2984193 RepID=A0ABU9C053_9BURK
MQLPSISGSKQPLSITGCTINDSTGIVTVDSSAQYKLLINPSEFSHERTICYNTKRTQGQVGNPVKFSAINPDKISFSVVFDGTGAVPSGLGIFSSTDVADQIESLSNIIYDYQGGKHQPNPVQILWGTLIFYGRLQSLSTNYTLFKPSGAPLRAKADLQFMGFVSNEEGRIYADRSSPDLSHSVEVREGDTLPLLCQRIYGDSRYYPEVAAYNGLREFRRLQPGVRLHFPPLR